MYLCIYVSEVYEYMCIHNIVNIVYSIYVDVWSIWGLGFHLRWSWKKESACGLEKCIRNEIRGSEATWERKGKKRTEGVVKKKKK